MIESTVADFQLAEIAAACGVMLVFSCVFVGIVLIAKRYLK